MVVIALGGQTGGGGRIVGPVVADRLGIDYVDRLILTQAAIELGATVGALHEIEEKRPSNSDRFFSSIQKILHKYALANTNIDPYSGQSAIALLLNEYEDESNPLITTGQELDHDNYIVVMAQVINELANKGDVVIVGRGACIILRDNPNVLRVGLIANLEDRINRIMEREGVTHEKAVGIIAGRDESRNGYFTKSFNIPDPDSPSNYHYVLNTSELDINDCANIIKSSCALIYG